MQSLVRRGPDEYPGAVWVEFPTGRINLSKMPANRRNAIASRLLSSGSGVGVVTVGRQLVDGDMVLMNRQVREELLICMIAMLQKEEVDPMMRYFSHAPL